jgi:hypothetical protein
LNTSTGTSCPAGPIYSNVTVNDPSGAAHPFPTSFTINTCSTASLNAVATTDGSGYTLVIPNQENGPWWIYDKSGNYANFRTTFPSAVYTADGAVVESNTDDGFGTFTDSLNEQVLTATPGSEHRVTNGTFTYADASGTEQTYTMNMAQYNFASAFGCAGISEYQTSPQTGLYLGASVASPSGGVYRIAYYSNSRLASITYPTGGSISYSYAGGTNGINCNSGVVPTLTVTVNDNNGSNSVWTIVNSNNSGSTNNFTVTVTDPASNQSVYNFGGEYQTRGACQQL